MTAVLKAGVASALLLAGALGAQAADLAPAYKAPASAIVAPYSWTGFYVGANLGYGWAHANATATVAGVASSASENLNGVVGGFQAGYNWQVGQWVWGLETDIQGTGQKATTSATNAGVTATETDKLPWFGTTRARVGFAADNWLFYATGGIGYGEFKSDLSFSGAFTGTASSSTTRAAWVAGAGIESAINRSNWTWRVEYLHLDSGTISNSYTIAGVAVTTSARATDEILRAGLNYRF